MKIILIVFVLQQNISSSSKFNHIDHLIFSWIHIISYLPWHDIEDLFTTVTEI